MAQNGVFEISVQGGVPLISSKVKTIETYNSNLSVPTDPDLTHPFSIWNTKQLDFNFYLEKAKGMSLSFGVRMFQFGWEIDTIKLSIYQGSVNPPTGYWKTYHARQDTKLGLLLPTIGIGYEFELFDHFWLRNSFSMGLTWIASSRKRYTHSYDGGQDAFDYQFGESGELSFHFDYEKNVLDLQLQSSFSWKYQGLSVYLAPSYYYFRKQGWTTYGGFHLNAGLAYRFKGKGKEIGTE